MKKIKVLGIIVTLILILTSTVVFADEAKFELEMQPDKSEVNREDTLNLTVIMKNDNTGTGINGFTADFVYNTDIFELQKNSSNLDAYVDNNKFDSIIKETSIVIVNNNFDTIEKNETIVTIPFKIKEGAKLGKTKISINTIEGGYLDDDSEKSYTGTCKDIEVTITEESQEDDVKLERIDIEKEPNKTKYKVGEKFNTEGMMVQAVYSDGSTSSITEYSYEPTGALTEKDENIVIKYKEGNITKTVSLPITVSDPQLIVEVTKLASIAVSKNPNKTEYLEGEKFDASGMEVTATYTDGTSKKITNYTIEPKDELKANNKEIKIKYVENNVEKQCTFPITVKSKQNENKEDTKKEENKQEDTKNVDDNQKSNNEKKDGTESNGDKLPQTGISYIYYMPLLAIVGLSIFSILCYKKYKK